TQVGGEAAGAVTVASVGEALIGLLDSLNVERGTTHPGGGDQCRLARREPQAANGERIRRGRPLKVDIDAAGNLLEPLAVTGPVPLTIGRQAEQTLTAVLELDLDVARAPASIDLDPIADDIVRCLIGLHEPALHV